MFQLALGYLAGKAPYHFYASQDFLDVTWKAQTVSVCPSIPPTRLTVLMKEWRCVYPPQRCARIEEPTPYILIFTVYTRNGRNGMKFRYTVTVSLLGNLLSHVCTPQYGCDDSIVDHLFLSDAASLLQTSWNIAQSKEGNFSRFYLMKENSLRSYWDVPPLDCLGDQECVEDTFSDVPDPYEYECQNNECVPVNYRLEAHCEATEEPLPEIPFFVVARRENPLLPSPEDPVWVGFSASKPIDDSEPPALPDPECPCVPNVLYWKINLKWADGTAYPWYIRTTYKYRFGMKDRSDPFCGGHPQRQGLVANFGCTPEEFAIDHVIAEEYCFVTSNKVVFWNKELLEGSLNPACQPPEPCSTGTWNIIGVPVPRDGSLSPSDLNNRDNWSIQQIPNSSPSAPQFQIVSGRMVGYTEGVGGNAVDFGPQISSVFAPVYAYWIPDGGCDAPDNVSTSGGFTPGYQFDPD